MNDDAPKPLSYAAPERKPRFHVTWAGWAVLIIFVVVMLLSRWF